MSLESRAIRRGLNGPESAIENYRKLLRNEVIEECALICDERAAKHGKDDEAENEPQLLAALLRQRKSELN